MDKENTQTSKNDLSLVSEKPEETVVYHTISGGPETLKEVRKDHPEEPEPAPLPDLLGRNKPENEESSKPYDSLLSLDLSKRPKIQASNDSTFGHVCVFFASVIVLYLIYVWRTKDEPHTVYFLLYQIEWLVHEFGHVLFGLFGDFLTSLGGSLLQVAVPLLITYFFYRQRSYLFASFSLFFVGGNILDVAHYAADAQDRKLTLSSLSLESSQTIGHDWYTIFSTLHVLEYTRFISGCMYLTGWAVVFTAFFFCCKYAYAPLERNEL